MTLSIFSSADNALFLVRWLHVFFGIIWIGLLYYFNFVQGAFFAETDAATKSGAIIKLVPRALWWFRWGSFWTMLMGVVYLAVWGGLYKGDAFAGAYGLWILTGGAMGLIMGANVWFVIWPNQQIIIASATQAAAGKGALPEAAAAGAKAGLASRTNTLLSMPMLFCMLAARHLPAGGAERAGVVAVTLAVLIGLIELNGLKGKLGPLTSIKGVIHCSAALTVLVYLIIDLGL